MRSELDRLADIFDSITMIGRCVEGMDAGAFIDAFNRDDMLADTIAYRFIVIGEAISGMLENPKSGHPSATVIAKNPDIDWKGYAGMRNVFAHQYFRLIPEQIWAAIEKENRNVRGTRSDHRTL